MSSPTPRHDALGGSFVALWLGGMGVALCAEDAAVQSVGGWLWGVGVVGGLCVAVHVYRTRSRYAD